MIGPASVVGALVLLLGGVGALAQVTLRAPVTPDPDILGRMAIATLVGSLPVAIPVGFLAGLISAGRRIAAEGAWLALGTLGVSGRSLLAPIALVATVAAVSWGVTSHLIEPSARAALRDLRVDAAVRTRPEPGRVLPVGPWLMTIERDKLAFAAGDWLGTARRWQMAPSERAVVAVLEDVSLRAWDGSATAHLERAVVPFGLAGAGSKVHISELTTPELLDQLQQSDALGRGAYERWVLWKRTLLPLLLLPFAIAALPLGLGPRRPQPSRWPVAVVVGLQVACLWGAVRVVDQRLGDLGVAGAACVVSAFALAWPVAAWARWEAR